jgi:tetratricopeptide (TPR) repeat protein
LLTEMDRRPEALAVLADALAIYERRGDLRAGDAANNLGHAHATAGDPRAAAKWFERSQAMYERHLGSDAAQLTYPLLGRARALIELGQAADAVPLAERSHRLCLAAPLHDTLCATVGFTLSRALWDAGSDRSRAHQLAVAARTVFTAHDDHEEIAHVDAWLATHASAQE